MGDVKLTKNAKTVLKKLCSQYEKRIRNGMSKSEAADFDDSKNVHKELFPKWAFDDVDSACLELLNAELLTGLRADGYVYRVYLSNAGIEFNRGLGSKTASKLFECVLELVQAIRSLLPW